MQKFNEWEPIVLFLAKKVVTVNPCGGVDSILGENTVQFIVANVCLAEKILAIIRNYREDHSNQTDLLQRRLQRS